MSNQVASVVDQLSALVPDRGPSSLFAPELYIDKNGQCAASIRPQSAYHPVSMSSIVTIVRNYDEFCQAAIAAGVAAKAINGDPKRLAAMAAAQAAKKQARASKGKQKQASTVSDYASDLAALQ